MKKVFKIRSCKTITLTAIMVSGVLYGASDLVFSLTCPGETPGSCLAAFTGGQPSLPLPAATADTTDPELSSSVLTSAPGAAFFGPVTLTDETGRPRAVFEDLVKDRVVVINFIFTACADICSLETARLKTVYDQLGARMGKDIFFISISIDPETDSPPVLARYKKKFAIGAGWTFLTGSIDDVLTLRKKLGLLGESEQADMAGKNGYQKSNHGLALLMGNQSTGQWVKRSNLDDSTLMAHMITALHRRQPEPSPLKIYTEAPTRMDDGLESAGDRLFQNRCADCHGSDGGIGGSLNGVTTRHKTAWLRRWISEPDVVLAEGDETARALVARQGGLVMPNLRLTEDEVSTIMEVLTRRDAINQLRKKD